MSDDISSLIGLLVDFSGSMKTSAGCSIPNEKVPWARSVLEVTDNIIKHDVSPSNETFVLGVGASNKEEILDVIGTLNQFKSWSYDWDDNNDFDITIYCILNLLEKYGARFVRKWADMKTIRDNISIELAKLVLKELSSNKDFAIALVDDFLPQVLKGVINRVNARDVAPKLIDDYLKTKTESSHERPTHRSNPFHVQCIEFAKYLKEMPLKVVNSIKDIPGQVFDSAKDQAVKELQSPGVDAIAKLHPANRKDMQKLVKQIESFFLKDFNTTSIYNVGDASRIIHRCFDDRKMRENRIDKMLETVEPFIYRLTPIYRALKTISKIFCDPRYMNHVKVLLIMSDGMPTDRGNIQELLSTFRNADVRIVSCYITNKDDVEPKRLYSEVNRRWEDGAKFLYDISSNIPTQLLPRTIFLKQGWKINEINNETRLFLQVNHPDLIKDVSDLAKNVVCFQDTLADILVSVSLDIYINQDTTGFKAKCQVGGTCYANASAAVLHLAMKRILGRKGGYRNFDELRQDLITRYGEDGANTSTVLENVCPQYRLHCNEVDIKGALRAVIAKRPVVATFRLTDREWDVFSAFYENNKTGIITTDEIDIDKRSQSEEDFGHAVVLTSFNSECLRFMNSWGTDWGDLGFFRVQKAEVLDFKFIDVYWTLDDLYQEEKDYYAKHGSEVAARVINNLKGLQSATYPCPLCRIESLVTDFSGNLLNAKCPRCLGEFRSDKEGNILALNLYLLSLSR